MVGSKGERIIRAMKLMRKSTVKKTTGPNCGQKASVTCFCRTLSKRSLATFFLFATLRYLHAIRSSLQALQRTNPEANHKASSELPQKPRGDSQALREDFKGYRKFSTAVVRYHSSKGGAV